MVEIKYVGRLGNKLFTYAAGRIIAEEMGYKLFAKPIEGFEGTQDLVDGECHHEPVQNIAPNDRPRLSDITSDRRPRKILLKSYMHDYEHIKNRENAIKRWFRQPSGERVDASSVIVHVRLKDFVDLGWAVTMDYYTKIIDENFSCAKILVMTDDPKSSRLSAFDKYKAEIHSGDHLEQFRLMNTAENLTIGTSTFAWWAAFISEARVFAPTMKRGHYFSKRQTNDKYIVEEKRYIYIKDVETISERGT